MKLTTLLLLPALALAPAAAQAQTSAAAKPHTVTTHKPAAESHSACVELPALSPQIPTLPGGSTCAKALYTLTSEPAIKTDYVSPLEGTALRDTLGLGSDTFSLGYIDTKVGTGELAEPHKWFTIQYTGYLVNGTKFDSSYDHPGHEPFVFQYGQHQVVAGWDTGFAGMRVGGKRRLFIPYQLAYGPTAHGTIPAKSMLVFDLEFIGQSDQKPEPKAPPVSAAPAESAPPADRPAPQPETAPGSKPQ